MIQIDADKGNMLKTTNIEADMLAKRREYDRQLEWEEEYSRQRWKNIFWSFQSTILTGRAKDKSVWDTQLSL